MEEREFLCLRLRHARFIRGLASVVVALSRPLVSEITIIRSP
jgi:hypothetical protein